MKTYEPLCDKVNTVACGVHHGSGPDHAWYRHTKAAHIAEADEVKLGAMQQGKRRGLEHTLLFRFRLFGVGRDWTTVHTETQARLDWAEPIIWRVALHPEESESYFRSGESSLFSGRRVTEYDILALVDPDLDENALEPRCACCTHTLNGQRFIRACRPGDRADLGTFDPD